MFIGKRLPEARGMPIPRKPERRPLRAKEGILAPGTYDASLIRSEALSAAPFSESTDR